MKPLQPDRLYVGTNYHPHDWDKTRWAKDLDLMKGSSFSVVRLGHLCWDSFEPEEGHFCFDWMDEVMDLCAQRDIGVFLDIPTRPAPTWLHKKYPSIDITDRSGVRQNSHTRYMEDVGDPHFQTYAYRLAEQLARRYASHPALLAFGLCNELGSGYLSYSATALHRFQDWLRRRYHTVAELNRVWAAHRWSRKINSFDQVDFPIGGTMVGAPERYLDMRRFFSDEIVTYMKELKDVLNRCAPGVPVSSNHWSENPAVGFDYNRVWEQLSDFSGQGFYPGINPEDENGVIGACFTQDHRRAEHQAPNWNLEFQTGTGGGYACPPGAMRMYAYLSSLHGSGAHIAWTWRTMLGGEEQYFFGLLDHDGEPSRKLPEFARIAREAEFLSRKHLLPLHDKPRVAIAYSYEDELITQYARDYYTTTHQEQVLTAYRTLFHRNIPCRVVDLRHIKESYDILLLPGVCQMGPEQAATIRRFVENGGTVILSAFSAKVDEYNQGFSTPQPGRLSDLFGVQVRGFDRAYTHVSRVNEGCLQKEDLRLHRQHVTLVLDGEELDIPVDYHEFLRPQGAESWGVYQNAVSSDTTAISCRQVGKGRAIYVGIPMQEELLARLLGRCGVVSPFTPALPDGISAARLHDTATLYVNRTHLTKQIPVQGHALLGNQVKDGILTLPPYEADIIES